MGTLRFFEEVVSFKIRRTFGFADYRGWFHDLLPQSFFSLFILLSTDCRTFTHNPGNIGKNPGLSPDCHLSYLLPALTIYVYI